MQITLSLLPFGLFIVLFFSGGMGDVTKRPVRLDMVRRGQGYELFANRNDRNQRSVDNGGDRPGQIVPN